MKNEKTSKKVAAIAGRVLKKIAKLPEYDQKHCAFFLGRHQPRRALHPIVPRLEDSLRLRPHPGTGPEAEENMNGFQVCGTCGHLPHFYGMCQEWLCWCCHPTLAVRTTTDSTAIDDPAVTQAPDKRRKA